MRRGDGERDGERERERWREGVREARTWRHDGGRGRKLFDLDPALLYY